MHLYLVVEIYESPQKTKKQQQKLNKSSRIFFELRYFCWNRKRKQNEKEENENKRENYLVKMKYTS